MKELPSRIPGDPAPGVIPVRFLEYPHVREQVKVADVVWGLDRRSGTRSLFFGKTTLEDIVNKGEARAVRTLTIAIDAQTDELEYLYAAVQVLKGTCCYDEQGGNSDR